jgi:hypothetical protein
LEYVLSFKNPATRKERIRDFKYLPKTLDQAYEQLWARLQLDTLDEFQQSDILKTFAWIMYARRPLRVAELAELLSVREGDRGLNEDMMHEKDILELCRGFIVVERKNRTLQLTHQTAQIFLQRHHLNDIGPKRIDIATTCLRYLQFDEFEKWEERDFDDWEENYKALSYIASHWGDHVKEAEDSDYVRRAVLTFLASESKRNLMLKITHMRAGSWTILHIIAENGWETIFGLVLDAQQAGTAKGYIPAVSA